MQGVGGWFNAILRGRLQTDGLGRHCVHANLEGRGGVGTMGLHLQGVGLWQSCNIARKIFT